MHAHVRAAAIAVAAFAVMLATAQNSHARGGAETDRVEKRIVRLINHQRAQRGLPRVRISRALNRSANYHCSDMLRHDFFAHTSSNGVSMGHRVASFRRSREIGENLAYARRGGARRIVRMWMHSPGHRAMILHRPFRRIGIARRKGTLGTIRTMVYTADFATRR
jgi:uncharacterized protein YkwD